MFRNPCPLPDTVSRVRLGSDRSGIHSLSEIPALLEKSPNSLNNLHLLPLQLLVPLITVKKAKEYFRDIVHFLIGMAPLSSREKLPLEVKNLGREA